MERWKPIPGWEVYEISTQGRVRRGSHLLRPCANRWSGYLYVGLCIRNHRKNLLVHRLVLMTFRPRHDCRLFESDHRDRNRANNALSNLRWTTSTGNKANVPLVVKQNCQQRKLSHGTAQAIRKLYIRGKVRQQDIATRFGISRTIISRVVNGRAWYAGRVTRAKKELRFLSSD